MGIFNEFNKKEKPVFTGSRFGFGSGGGAAGGDAPSYLDSAGITASGGTETLTPGDGYKYHFFGSGGPTPFNVTGVTGTGYVEYVVIAGGGGGGSDGGGGGGAGGFRTNAGILNYLQNGSGAHPLSGLTTPYLITATVQNYTFEVGAGGSRGSGNEDTGSQGNPSTAFGIASTGGGAGVGWGGNAPGAQPVNGGSGGGRGSNSNDPGASSYPYHPVTYRQGNSPPVTPPQGNPGGGGGNSSGYRAGGGGGAGAAGSDGGPSSGGAGGNGVPVSEFTIPPSYGTPGPAPGRWFAGGGGGGMSPSGQPTAPGGAGGGGAAPGGAGTQGTDGTGGGGGGGYENDGDGGNGGSGIIIVRYRV